MKLTKSLSVGASWVIRRHPATFAVWVALIVALAVTGRWWAAGGLLAGVLVPGLAGSAAGRRWPDQWRRYVRAPRERRRWKRRARRQWDDIADRCGLSQQTRKTRWTRRAGRWKKVIVTTTRRPRLKRPKARGNTLILTIRHRRGQSNDDVLKQVEQIVSTLGAVEWATSQPNLQQVVVEAVMRDSLKVTRNAKMPTSLRDPIGMVEIGTRQDGDRLRLNVRSQTMIFGVTGSGKNSIMNGALVQLAPGVPDATVQLWGCDLKGTEFGPFREIFHGYTQTVAGAVHLLRRLMAVKDARQVEMGRTRSRFYEPRPGHPLHVLVVDEFAAPSYDGTPAGRKLAAEFYGLMAVFLTQGRSYGISVIAGQQDPRKEVSGLRDRFSQFVCLRMSTPEETAMAIGRGVKVPAHLIAKDKPGTGFIIEDDRHVVKFRADWFSDEVMRATGRKYPAPVDVTGLTVVGGVLSSRPVGVPRRRGPDRRPRTRAASAGTVVADTPGGGGGRGFDGGNRVGETAGGFEESSSPQQ